MYEERLKHYLDDCDENTDLIKEAIASLEGHFELTQENELLHFSRVDAVAYLALKSIVRCKDCRNSKVTKRIEGTYRHCPILCADVDEDFYCGFGKAKDGDGE